MVRRTRPIVTFTRTLPLLYWLARSSTKFYLITRLYGITCQNVVISASNIYKIALFETTEKRIICTPEKLGSWDLGMTHVPCSGRGYTCKCLPCITNTMNNKCHLSKYNSLLRNISVISFSHLCSR